MSLDPGNGGLLIWIIVGVVAGFFASRAMKGGAGYGLVGDLVIGLLGAVIGGYLIGLFVHTSVGLFGTIVVAFIGACVLLFAVRSMGGRYGQSRR